MASISTYLQALLYIALLFFIIPIKINGPSNEQLEFDEYLKIFNKTYDDPQVYQMRLEAFQKSLETIHTLNMNRSNHSAHYGLTKFSDLHPNEFIDQLLSQKTRYKTNKQQFDNIDNDIKVIKNEYTRTKRKITDLPRKIDWREKNAVTKIRNQRNCGACWAFTVVEMIESMYAIQNGKLIDLSIQQLIDCAGYNNKGCDGGDICTLLAWMKDNNIQLQLETDYPLELQQNECRTNGTVRGVEVNDYSCENMVGYEDVILELLARNGPVGVAINAQTWQNYIGGVIQYHCSSDIRDLNHAVEIVGYDLTAPIPYYIARNTWGEDFGDHGYLYLAIHSNICGVANEVSAITIL